MQCWTNDITKNIKTAFQPNVSLVFAVSTCFTFRFTLRNIKNKFKVQIKFTSFLVKPIIFKQLVVTTNQKRVFDHEPIIEMTFSCGPIRGEIK